MRRIGLAVVVGALVIGACATSGREVARNQEGTSGSEFARYQEGTSGSEVARYQEGTSETEVASREGGRVDSEVLAWAGSGCGSGESDLFGCTSAECCARTGADCGDVQCVCRPLRAASGEER